MNTIQNKFDLSEDRKVSIDNMVDFGKTHSLYKPPNLPSRPKRPNLPSRLKRPIPSSRVTHLTKTTFPFSATAPIIFGFSFINYFYKKYFSFSYLPNHSSKDTKN